MKALKIILAVIAVSGFFLIVVSAGACDADMLSFKDCAIRGIIGLLTVLSCCGMLCLLEVRHDKHGNKRGND
jgi:hypothetical protein